MRVLLITTIFLTVSAAFELPDFLKDAVDTVSSWISSSPKVIDLSTLKYITNISTFEEFKDKTGRDYGSSDEEEKRREIFYENQNLINTHNERFDQGEASYVLDVNFFSDFKPSQILGSFTGIRKTPQGNAKAVTYLNLKEPPKFPGKVPSMVDWVEKGAITRIKYQRECKASWAFAATGAVEGHLYAKKNILVSLSEQELIDCSDSHHNQGCEGGFHDYAFAFIAQNGILSDNDYPYTGSKGSCQITPKTQGTLNSKYHIDGFRKISPGDEKELKRVVANLGPVACSMYAVPEDFLFFKNGIYNNPKCQGNSPQHSVLIVGYGKDKGKPYWLIKNSWGHTWGNTHYAGIPRNINFCGITSDCSYPVISKN